ncbi:holo-ACP synthase [Anoxybacteroides amylolyticum]|uniref:Holo-[acyl-carrier-protein] synthase n=1 Tax=Anoxybacteroides amylolyticum TaxID=294699 RepID=A0A160F6U4_9BACL|nr:holo-ACP synthase [Anoxybacillus amylolyticus]ANB62347.1 holo-[acyl-carrier-protein] synthase [Anoxybacillus amylolyticus]
MIIGVGIDIIELARIEKFIAKEKFIARILTEREKTLLARLSGRRKVEFLAGRFAAKEAYAKALGTGIGKEVSFQDIEVINDEYGKPAIVSPTEHQVHVSISHSQEYAVAQVIIERLSC